MTTTETNLPVHPTSLVAHTNCHMPQDYVTGYLYPYSKEKWDGWLRRYSLQSNTTYKICTGKNSNKESDTGVLEWQGKIMSYSVNWRQNYSCSGGGKPRYNDHSQQKGGKVRNAPGSRLMECNATINICLTMRCCKLCSHYSQFILTTPKIPLQTCTPTNPYIVPEVMEKVESLIHF